MSQPFVGQIVAVGFNFAPSGWHLCDGSVMAISENTTLYTLIGTTYGGDGVTTFNLPDLRGRGVVGTGQGVGLSNYVPGQVVGSEQVTLTSGQIAAHTHPLNAAATVTIDQPANTVVLGKPSTQFIYATGGGTTSLSPKTVGSSPGSGAQPHENRQPYLTINYIIALYGIYPSQP